MSVSLCAYASLCVTHAICLHLSTPIDHPCTSLAESTAIPASIFMFVPRDDTCKDGGWSSGRLRM